MRNVTTAPSSLAHFTDLLAGRVDARARRWLEEALAQVADRSLLLESYTATARRLGKARLGLTAEEAGTLARAGIDWPLGSWAIDDLGRVALLVAAAAHRSVEALEALVDDCYRHGDNRERQAALRALPFLPDPPRFVALGVDACRTSIQPVFEAIACENPFPARHFPEHNFNQMVLKAVFTGVALARIVGLEGRRTSELRRMAEDYASERRAAGRPVPPDLGLLTDPKERVR